MKGESPSFRRSGFNEPFKTWMSCGTPCVWAEIVMGTGFILDTFISSLSKTLGADAAFQLFQLKAEPQTMKGGEKRCGIGLRIKHKEKQGCVSLILSKPGEKHSLIYPCII